MIAEPTRAAFLKTWPGGYRENWAVYGSKTEIAEPDLVSKALAPFYNKNHVCLEIGCGLGFWTEKYLSPNFQRVIALDLIPDPHLKGNNIQYIEVPDRNYDCFGVPDESVDFVWSFGVFCHLPLHSVQRYLESIHRVLKPNGWAVLYFSNTERRPGGSISDTTENDVPWVQNNLHVTRRMLDLVGLYSVAEPCFKHVDTIVQCQKAIPGHPQLSDPPIIHHRLGFGQYLTDNSFVGEGVEIGVQTGEFSESILRSWMGKVHLVDPWKPQNSSVYLDPTGKIDFEKALEMTQNRMRIFGDRVAFHRMLSEEAVKLFEDNSLDFVYIDGNHKYEACKQDIEMWLPKIRPGGIIGGHDFMNIFVPGSYDCGVMKAVAEWSTITGIPYYASDGGCSSWWSIKP